MAVKLEYARKDSKGKSIVNVYAFSCFSLLLIYGFSFYETKKPLKKEWLTHNIIHKQAVAVNAL